MGLGKVKFPIVLAAASLLLVSIEAAAAGSKLQKHTIVVGERERSYLLYVPRAVADSDHTRPLILVFHGGGGTSRGIAREVGRSLHKIADKEGIVVAYPHAVNRTWDFGAGIVSEALEERIDDRSYFEQLINKLVTTEKIDETRIFATGISRGGQASYFVACEFPDRIRAIAPVAMPMPVFMQESCAAEDVGLAVLNGTADPLVPYDGGPITVGRKQRGIVMSTDDTIADWLERNACDPALSDTAVLDDARDRMRVERTSWEECRQDPVVLYRIEDGGHTWPSGRQYLPRWRIGRVNKDIDGATEVWAFFSRYETEHQSPDAESTER